MKANNHQRLFEAAVKRVREHLAEKGMAQPNKTTLAKEMAMKIGEDHGFFIADRTLRNYWGNFEEDSNYQIPTVGVLDGLAKICGSENYADWVGSQQQGKGKRFSRKHILIGAVLVWVVVLGSWYWFSEREQWMQWKGDHYEEVDFDAELLEQGVLKLYKEDRIQNFQKKHPDSIEAFFNGAGEPMIWYGKNPKGQYEYFTDLGLHPETGKTLKPITQYIINKYILPRSLEPDDSLP